MSLLSCLKCATKFAVGLSWCPHCLSEDFEEADVPKNTVGGGASYPQEAAAAPVEPEAAAPAAEVVTEPATPEPPADPEAEAAPVKPAPSLSRANPEAG